MPDTKVSQAGLKRADLVIVQDCYYPTETAEYADVLFPAAQWGEKRGTMTNSERLVVRSDKFLTPPRRSKIGLVDIHASRESDGIQARF